MPLAGMRRGVKLAATIRLMVGIATATITVMVGIAPATVTVTVRIAALSSL
jgi:hypothetical protein